MFELGTMQKITSWKFDDEDKQELLHHSVSQRSMSTTKWYNRGKLSEQPEKASSFQQQAWQLQRPLHVSHSWVFRTHRSASKNSKKHSDDAEQSDKSGSAAKSSGNIDEVKKRAKALEEIYEQKSQALEELYRKKRRILDELYHQKFKTGESSLALEERIKKAMKERKYQQRYLREKFNRLLDGPGDRNFSVASADYDWSSVISEDDDAVAVFNDKIFEEEFARSASFRYTSQDERWKAVGREPLGCGPSRYLYSPMGTVERKGVCRPFSAPSSESNPLRWKTPRLDKAPLETTYVFPDVSDYPEPGRDVSGGYLLGCAVKPENKNRVKVLRTLRQDLIFRPDSPWMESDSSQTKFIMRPHSHYLPRRQTTANGPATKGKNNLTSRIHSDHDRGRYNTDEVLSRPFSVPIAFTSEGNEKEAMECHRNRKKYKRWYERPQEPRAST